MVPVVDTAAPVPADRIPHATRRRLVAGAAAAGVLSLVAGWGFFRMGNVARVDGAALLELVLPDSRGHPQALAQWRGKVLVVNFWAPWCAPCRDEMPLFSRYQVANAANGVQFVGIAVDEPGKVLQFERETGLKYPALIGGYGALELSKQLGNDVSALPFTVVLDRAGRVAHTQLGPMTAAKLDGVLAPVLKPA